MWYTQINGCLVAFRFLSCSLLLSAYDKKKEGTLQKNCQFWYKRTNLILQIRTCKDIVTRDSLKYFEPVNRLPSVLIFPIIWVPALYLVPQRIFLKRSAQASNLITNVKWLCYMLLLVSVSFECLWKIHLLLLSWLDGILQVFQSSFIFSRNFLLLSGAPFFEHFWEAASSVNKWLLIVNSLCRAEASFLWLLLFLCLLELPKQD